MWVDLASQKVLKAHMVNEEYDQAVVKLLSREYGSVVQATGTLWLVKVCMG